MMNRIDTSIYILSIGSSLLDVLRKIDSLPQIQTVVNSIRKCPFIFLVKLRLKKNSEINACPICIFSSISKNRTV